MFNQGLSKTFGSRAACMANPMKDEENHDNGHYAVVGAQIIRPNSEYRVTATSFDLTPKLEMCVSLVSKGNVIESKDVSLERNDYQTIVFQLGSLPEDEYELVAEGKSGMVFRKKAALEYDDKFCSVLLQTDKAMYKPGDTVRFRVLVLDRNMKPVVAGSSMRLYICDGAGNRVKQWNDVCLDSSGVFEAELPLSTEPVLGEWKINVEVLGVKQTKSFDVDKYVLPTFEVSVKGDSYTTIDDETLKVTIESKYTYGKPVVGELTVTVKPQEYYCYGQKSAALCQKTVPINGKIVVEFNLQDELNLNSVYNREFLFEAEVREQLTGRTQSGSSIVKIHDDRYTVKLVEEAKYIPGLPYKAWIKVSNLDGSPVEPDSIMVLLRNDCKVQLTTYMLDTNGMTNLDLSLDNMKFTYLRIEVLFRGKSYEVEGISKPREKIGAFIRISTSEQQPSLGKDMKFDVCSTKPLKYVAYAVLSRGAVVNGGVVEAGDQTSIILTIPSVYAMVPRAKLLVYYMCNDGSLVSGSTTIEYRNIFENNLVLGIKNHDVKPGDAIDISVKANEESFVGLLAVDQSVLLNKAGNDLTRDCVAKELEAYETARNHSFYHHHDFPDFQDAGAVFISNAHVDHEEKHTMVFCAEQAVGGVAFGAPMMAMKKMNVQRTFKMAVTETKEPTIRSNFPETWIWESIKKSNKDDEVIRKIVPDTVTSWIISGFSLNQTSGLGLIESPAKINVFLPFFISMDLPYSVKHGESVRIPVIVFNYLDEDQMADVIFYNKNGEFEFMDDSQTSVFEDHHRRMKVLLAKDGGKTLSFMIKPKKIGHITLKITATCALAGDGIERELLVQPEGIPQYVNQATLIDLRSTSNHAKKLDIDIPSNTVPNSTKVSVSVIGDVLGSSIANLDSLIRMPYGCGEQNMLNFVPCIVVLDYLNASKRLTGDDKIVSKAKRCMEVGYQRELTYKHADGSFSAFGKSDKSGSTWLTAFVAKSFQQAAKYISIESDIVDKALDWLSKVQSANGSFPEVGNICHKDMQGGAAGGLALTAYTVIAFLESREHAQKYAETVTKALNYLSEKVLESCDVYAHALVAYALQIAGHQMKDEVMAKLDSKASVNDEMKWWSKTITEKDSESVRNNRHCCRPCSVDVEMSAYALLASLVSSTGLESLPVMKWLLAQRNDKGGFQSTQDTVVGLEALAKIAAKFSSDDLNITMVVKTDQAVQRSFNVDKDNALVLQKLELPQSVRSVEMTANGTGCALFQLSSKYHINETESSPRFKLEPFASKGETESCIKISITTCFIPSEDQPISNMAVMEIDMLSGFIIDSDSIAALKQHSAVKKIETKRGDTTLVLYFDNIGETSVALTVIAYRKHEVTDVKPANAIIYDYYDNTRRCSAFYEIPAC
ncbi:CD109 antigen-like isoform X2 [Anopheles albimanus]|uniref:TEP1-F n=1 Tax=Anopheles albimanus TaxID=7167 RepID=A0A8W7K6G7_ANOAL|nr:CD109 antigen-like isoform X2 [Anopheles albimanus]